MVKELVKDESYIVKRIIDYDEQEYYNNSFPIEVDMKTNKFDCTGMGSEIKETACF